ncbi:hypothetical protein ABID65_007513 [Bradyrhizobium sp. S3.9.2]|uniref:hypothetical protein n=1 Tax=Bradyrhizobium sp. S3.9.2 TaxID=3156432 RepID=UPI00339132D3
MMVHARLIAIVLCFGLQALPSSGEELILIDYRGNNNVPGNQINQLPRQPPLVMTHQSDRWTETDRNGTLSAPPGYFVCSINIVSEKTWIPNNGTFNGFIWQNGAVMTYLDALGTKGRGAQSRGSPRTLIEVHLRLASEDRGGCMSDGVVWQCGKKTPAGQGKCGADQPGGIR